MPQLPEAPLLRRYVPRKGQLAALLAGLAVLPLIAILGELDRQAKASVLHVVATFAVLTLAFRVLGKRELGRLSPFELVTLMLIPEIMSNALQGEGALGTSLAGLSTILLLVLGTSLLSQRFPPVQRVLEASPTLLAANGKMLEESMNKERIAPDELYSEMRKQGVERLEQVRFAVLESSGNVTIISVGGAGSSGDDGGADALR